MRTSLIVIAVLALCVSCAGDKKEAPGKESIALKDSAANKTNLIEKEDLSLVGRWKPVEMNLPGITEEEKKDMKENIILEFTREGNYTGYNKENKQEGTYSYDANTKKLSVENKANSMDKEVFTIGWEDGLLMMTNEEGTVKLKKQ